MQKFWTEENNLSKGIKLILLFLYPFGAFLYSLRNVGSRASYFVFYAIFILFGVTFVAQDEAADSFRYVEEFQLFCINPSANLQAVFQEYTQPDSAIKDLYKYVVYFVSSTIAGNNYHFMFLLIALVFGYYSLASLRYITNNPVFKNTLPFFIFLFLFTFSNSIFNINGFRFWTASWVAIYASLKILVDKKYIYILYFSIIPLIHLTFILYIAIFLISLFIRRYPKAISILFFISFFYSDIVLKSIGDIKDIMPQNIQNLIWSYTESEGAMEKITGEADESKPLYAIILTALPRYYIIIMSIILIKELGKIKENSISYFVTCMFLSMQTLFNFCMAIPSMARFNYTLIPLLVFAWVNSYDSLKKYNTFLMLAPFAYCYHIWYWIRNMISVSDPLFYISNAPHLIIKNFI